MKKEEYSLKKLNPYGPLENYRYLRRLWRREENERIIQFLFEEWEKERDPDVGEWALLFSYHWWRMEPLGEKRVRVARVARKMSLMYQSYHPEDIRGFFWNAVHTGMEALSLGILNALQHIPTFTRNLEIVLKRDPTYFYGGTYTLLAKMYMKVPPFPLSVGDLTLSKKYLEEGRKYQERKIALWYLVAGELKIIEKKIDEGIRLLKRMEEEVRPTDAMTMYALIAGIHDGTKLREVVEKGTYDRYQWDPLLEPVDLNLIEQLESRYGIVS